MADPRVAEYLELNDPAARARRERDEFFIVEGPTAIERLSRSSYRTRSVLVSESASRRLETMISVFESTGVPVYVTSREILAGIAGFDLHRGAVAAADRRPLPNLDEVLDSARSIAILEGLNDPENLGAIVRSASALGIDALVIDPTCIDPLYRRTVRVSMGAVLFMPVARVANWPDALDQIRSAGFEIWAMTPAGDASTLWSTPIPERIAVVFGPEGPGLDPATQARCDRRVQIPVANIEAVDSLNVAAAAAICFAEITRQRHLA
jgi:tRNA G18 (ribose-2'-O)-methylase SpoU